MSCTQLSAFSQTTVQSSFTVTLNELYSTNRLSANLKFSPVVLRLFMSFTQLSHNTP